MDGPVVSEQRQHDKLRQNHAQKAAAKKRKAADVSPQGQQARRSKPPPATSKDVCVVDKIFNQMRSQRSNEGAPDDDNSKLTRQNLARHQRDYGIFRKLVSSDHIMERILGQKMWAGKVDGFERMGYERMTADEQRRYKESVPQPKITRSPKGPGYSEMPPAPRQIMYSGLGPRTPPESPKPRRGPKTPPGTPPPFANESPRALTPPPPVPQPPFASTSQNSLLQSSQKKTKKPIILEDCVSMDVSSASQCSSLPPPPPNTTPPRPPPLPPPDPQPGMGIQTATYPPHFAPSVSLMQPVTSVGDSNPGVQLTPAPMFVNQSGTMFYDTTVLPPVIISIAPPQQPPQLPPETIQPPPGVAMPHFVCQPAQQPPLETQVQFSPFLDDEFQVVAPPPAPPQFCSLPPPQPQLQPQPGPPNDMSAMPSMSATPLFAQQQPLGPPPLLPPQGLLAFWSQFPDISQRNNTPAPVNVQATLFSALGLNKCTPPPTVQPARMMPTTANTPQGPILLDRYGQPLPIPERCRRDLLPPRVAPPPSFIPPMQHLPPQPIQRQLPQQSMQPIPIHMSQPMPPPQFPTQPPLPQMYNSHSAVSSSLSSPSLAAFRNSFRDRGRDW